jgi:hypothetical protein
MIEQQIRNELIFSLAKRAEVDEQIATARAMLRALELQRKANESKDLETYKKP